MGKVVVYDKVSWHYPEGRNCPNLETAKSLFRILMNWLNKNNLLSEEGKEIFELGIDRDFSITSSMLNEKGNELFSKYYSKWLRSITYENINTKLLDELIKNI